MNPEEKPQTKKQPETTPEPAAEQPLAQPAQDYQPPQQQPVQQAQYIVTQRSLNGIGGWLTFWIIAFSLSTISMISIFIAQISGEMVQQDTVLTVFSPILSLLSLGAVIGIIMRLKLGRWLAIASLLTGALYVTISTFINMIDGMLTAAITTVIITWIVNGLLSLYFVKSERVHQTLVK